MREYSSDQCLFVKVLPPHTGQRSLWSHCVFHHVFSDSRLSQLPWQTTRSDTIINTLSKVGTQSCHTPFQFLRNDSVALRNCERVTWGVYLPRQYVVSGLTKLSGPNLKGFPLKEVQPSVSVSVSISADVHVTHTVCVRYSLLHLQVWFSSRIIHTLMAHLCCVSSEVMRSVEKEDNENDSDALPLLESVSSCLPFQFDHTTTTVAW